MKDSDTLSEGEILSLMQSARLKSKIGNTEGAIKVYRRIIERKPDYIDAYTELARLYLDMDKFEETRRLSEKALQIDEKNTDANFIVGVLSYIFGNFQKALHHYETVRAQSGLDVSLAVNIGLCYEALGDLQNAARFFETAVSEGVDNWRIYEALAETYASLGEQEKEIATLESALKRFKNIGRLYLLAGRAYLKKGNIALAGLRLERAEKLLPDDVEVKRLLGKFLVESAQFERAEEVMRWVVAHEAWRTENWLLYAKAKAALGKQKDALNILQLASKLLDDSLEIKQIIGELRSEIDGTAR